MVAAAVVGSAVAGVAGSAISGSASKSAAKTAANAADQSALVQQQMFQQSQADLQPYRDAGLSNLNDVQNWYKVTADQAGRAFNAAQDHIPQAMTEENLVNTPGYQFNLSQGLRGIQNSAAAKGLGVSGAALQGAGRYATGLADSTYQNQFNNQQQIYNDYLSQAGTKLNQLNSIYNQITAPYSIGENAAASQGNNAISSGANIGNSLIQAGNANAAGITGQANAYGNALQGVGNAGLSYLGIQNALGGGSGGGGFADSGWG